MSCRICSTTKPGAPQRVSFTEIGSGGMGLSALNRSIARLRKSTSDDNRKVNIPPVSHRISMVDPGLGNVSPRSNRAFSVPEVMIPGKPRLENRESAPVSAMKRQPAKVQALKPPAFLPVQKQKIPEPVKAAVPPPMPPQEDDLTSSLPLPSEVGNPIKPPPPAGPKPNTASKFNWEPDTIVEVYSVSHKSWCKGIVTRIIDGMLMVQYEIPTGVVMQKPLEPDSVLVRRKHVAVESSADAQRVNNVVVGDTVELTDDRSGIVRR